MSGIFKYFSSRKLGPIIANFSRTIRPAIVDFKIIIFKEGRKKNRVVRLIFTREPNQ